MKSISIIVLACIFFAATVELRTYTNTLADCNAFAALFDNTCNISATPTTVALTTKQTVSCSNVGKCTTSGTLSGTTCSWSRQLCVTCSSVSDVTYIRVQTNSLPNHCTYSDMNIMKSIEVDFKVIFQRNVSTSASVQSSAGSTQTTLDSLICNIDKAMDTLIPTAAAYTKTSTEPLNTMTGVALSGGNYFNGLDLDNHDPFYPKAFGTQTTAVAETVDFCLAHASP